MQSTAQSHANDPADVPGRLAEMSAQVAVLTEQLAEAEREREVQGQRIDQLLESIEL